jgi:hypothetical protein
LQAHVGGIDEHESESGDKTTYQANEEGFGR